MLKALLLENVDKSVVSSLHKYNIEVEYISTAIDKQELIKKIKDVHIVGLRSKTKLTTDVLEHASKLLAIGCFCIGTDQVDLNYCMENGIAVFNSPYMSTRSVAELAIGLIISLSRTVGDKNTLMHNGTWQKSSAGCYEIRGKTLGIIGYGHVGCQLSVLAESMGMNVLLYDIKPVMIMGNGTMCQTMDELLQQSDFVSLHVPLTSETNNLIGSNELNQMKKGSYLLNLSRGKVLDIESARNAILNQHLAGLAIDVFPEEPKENTDNWTNLLQKLPNVILTPHIGGATIEAQHDIGSDVASKITNYIFYGLTHGSFTLPNLLANDTFNGIRILNIHKNVPGTIFKINNIISELNINVVNQSLSTKNGIGYCIIDINGDIDKSDFLEKIENLDVNISTRIIDVNN